MKGKAERLKRLTAQGMSLEELIRCIMSADPRPLWEEEKAKREANEAKKKTKTGKGEPSHGTLPHSLIE